MKQKIKQLFFNYSFIWYAVGIASLIIVFNGCVTEEEEFKIKQHDSVTLNLKGNSVTTFIATKRVVVNIVTWEGRAFLIVNSRNGMEMVPLDIEKQ